MKSSTDDLNDPHQNPLYPADKDLTEEEMYAQARTRSMARAQSPGELMCIIDDVSSLDQPVPVHDQVHGYEELMDWRYNHVIDPQDPWTYWMLYDLWAETKSPPL